MTKVDDGFHHLVLPDINMNDGVISNINHDSNRSVRVLLHVTLPKNGHDDNHGNSKEEEKDEKTSILLSRTITNEHLTFGNLCKSIVECDLLERQILLPFLGELYPSMVGVSQHENNADNGGGRGKKKNDSVLEGGGDATNTNNNGGRKKLLTGYRLRYGDGYATIVQPTWGASSTKKEVDHAYMEVNVGFNSKRQRRSFIRGFMPYDSIVQFAYSTANYRGGGGNEVVNNIPPTIHLHLTTNIKIGRYGQGPNPTTAQKTHVLKVKEDAEWEGMVDWFENSTLMELLLEESDGDNGNGAATILNGLLEGERLDFTMEAEKYYFGEEDDGEESDLEEEMGVAIDKEETEEAERASSSAKQPPAKAAAKGKKQTASSAKASTTSSTKAGKPDAAAATKAKASAKSATAKTASAAKSDAKPAAVETTNTRKRKKAGATKKALDALKEADVAAAGGGGKGKEEVDVSLAASTDPATTTATTITTSTTASKAATTNAEAKKAKVAKKKNKNTNATDEIQKKAEELAKEQESSGGDNNDKIVDNNKGGEDGDEGDTAGSKDEAKKDQGTKDGKTATKAGATAPSTTKKKRKARTVIKQPSDANNAVTAAATATTTSVTKTDEADKTDGKGGKRERANSTDDIKRMAEELAKEQTKQSEESDKASADSNVKANETPAASSKKKKRAKKESGGGATTNTPAKPLNAYQRFCNDARQKVVDANAGASNDIINKKLDEAYKALIGKEKKRYQKEASSEMKKFNENNAPADSTASPKPSSDKQAVSSSAKKRKALSPNDKFANIAPAPAEGLPNGWTTRHVKRPDGKREDCFWFSPKENIVFRSKVEVERFLGHLENSGGNENSAMESLKENKKGSSAKKLKKEADTKKRAAEPSSEDKKDETKLAKESSDKPTSPMKKKAKFNPVPRQSPSKPKTAEAAGEEDGGAKVSSATKAGKKRQRKKAATEENRPKRPLTAYMFFANENRSKIQQEFPGIAFTEVGQKMGEKWRALNIAEKKVYEDKAGAALAKWKIEKEAYDASLTQVTM